MSAQGSIGVASIRTVMVAGGIVVALLLGWTAIHAREQREAALKLVDRVEVERAEAERRADSLAASLGDALRRTGRLLDSLSLERQKADSLADVAAHAAASGVLRAIQIGVDLGETLVQIRNATGPPTDAAVDSAIAQLDQHLAADAQTVSSFQEQILAMEVSLRAEVEQKDLLGRRLADALAALSEREAECRLCREEIARLRDVKDPGWLEDIWSHGKSFVAGAAVGVGTLFIAMAF